MEFHSACHGISLVELNEPRRQTVVGVFGGCVVKLVPHN